MAGLRNCWSVPLQGCMIHLCQAAARLHCPSYLKGMTCCSPGVPTTMRRAAAMAAALSVTSRATRAVTLCRCSTWMMCCAMFSAVWLSAECSTAASRWALPSGNTTVMPRMLRRRRSVQPSADTVRLLAACRRLESSCRQKLSSDTRSRVRTAVGHGGM
jgi:hypothetical protein